MGDHIVVATAKNDRVLAYAADTRELVEELRSRHDTWPVATAALGRVATVGALLTPTLKEVADQITLQVQGDGPLGKIVVVAAGDASVRGYVEEPHVDLPSNALGKLDVGRGVGQNGFLYVIKDLGLKEPYRSGVPLIAGEIGEDFTYYFAVSEQTPSVVAVGVLVDTDLSVLAAGGLLLHVLPGVDESTVAELETAISSLPSVTSLLHQGESPQDILRRLFATDLRILETRSVRFACTCGRARLANVLVTLGAKELSDMLVEQGQAELVCHFCGERYLYETDELQILIEKAEALDGRGNAAGENV